MNHSKLSSIPTKHHLHIWGRPLHLKESPNSEELAQHFTGKERDRVSGLDYFGARYYDSDVGYWLSPDLGRQFWNLYGYSMNPINGYDPDGNTWIYSRGLGESGDASGVFGPLRHDQIFFDNPVTIDGKVVSNYGFFKSDNGGLRGDLGVYRAERGVHNTYLKNYTNMGWVPDDYALQAIKENSKPQIYNLGTYDCQSFSGNIFVRAKEIESEMHGDVSIDESQVTIEPAGTVTIDEANVTVEPSN